MSNTINQLFKSKTNPIEARGIYSDRLQKLSNNIKDIGDDFIRAIDSTLMQDFELRNEFNYELNKRQLPGVNYSYIANQLKRANAIDEDTYVRAGGTMDVVTNPGGANLLQTTVSDVIEKRIEQLGVVKNEVTTFDMLEKGNLQIPTYSAFATTTSVADNATLVNLGTTFEGGLSSITINPQKHGGYVPIFESFIQKLSGKNLTMLFDLVSEATARGIDNAILNGNGSAPNATGMNQNATTINFAGDALETFRLAMATVSDVHKGGIEGMVAFMSTASWLQFMEIFRDLQNDRPGIIDPVNRTIYGVRCVVTDVISNTGTSPAKSSVVTVGYAKSYKWGQTPVQIETDKFSGFLSATTNLRTLLFVDGKPAFNSSFAKFTLPNLF